MEIHPFVDGNGRVSRLLLAFVLVRLGLRPVPIEVPKQEYYAVMNHFFDRGDFQPLLDLYLRLAVDELD